jgi:hypothetical protein
MLEAQGEVELEEVVYAGVEEEEVAVVVGASWLGHRCVKS